MKQHLCTRQTRPSVTLLSLALLGTMPLAGQAEPLPSPIPALKPPVRLLPSVAAHVTPPSPEPDAATTEVVAGPNPFVGRAVTPNASGQSLTAPVTVNANTTADALTVTQTGGGRAINGAVNNGSNGLSAIKGVTNGSGSGVNGVTTGTKGQAGKFENTSTSSVQSTVLVTTAGLGNGLTSTITNTGHIASPALLGIHTVTDGYGVGVEGDGGQLGVKGVSTNGAGTVGFSTGGYGTYGLTQSGVGAYGESDSSYGVYGTSHSGYGVVGSSDSTYAGVFYGPVYVTGALYAASVTYTSDRDQKQDFTAVDSTDLLKRIATMPITAWDYKARPRDRHIGPMAQDFHAAFGLGADDKHIDVVDGIGVSLAAIKELQRQLQEKDAAFAELKAQFQALRDSLEARVATLEQPGATVALPTAHP